MALLEIKKFIEEKAGFSLSDRHDLPTSTATFPGGAHYRMEVPGIEKLPTSGSYERDRLCLNQTIPYMTKEEYIFNAGNQGATVGTRCYGFGHL